MELLTAKDVAALKGCSLQYIQLLLKEGKISPLTGAEVTPRSKYLIPLTALDAVLQRKWYKQRGVTPPAELHNIEKENPPKAIRPLEFYSKDQRGEIGRWIDVLDKWQSFRCTYQGLLSEADAAFISQEGLDVSIKTLYRRWAAYKNKEWDGLIDNRGRGNRGRSDIPGEIRDLFEYFYLDERAFSVKKCYEFVCDFLKLERPELLPQLPSYATAYRWALDISAPVACLARKGEKAFNDLYGIFVDRLYDDMVSNDYWIADGHRLDVITKSEDGKERRRRLTIDVVNRNIALTGRNVNPTRMPKMVSAIEGSASLFRLSNGLITMETCYVYLNDDNSFVTVDGRSQVVLGDYWPAGFYMTGEGAAAIIRIKNTDSWQGQTTGFLPVNAYNLSMYGQQGTLNLIGDPLSTMPYSRCPVLARLSAVTKDSRAFWYNGSDAAMSQINATPNYVMNW